MTQSCVNQAAFGGQALELMMMIIVLILRLMGTLTLTKGLYLMCRINGCAELLDPSHNRMAEDFESAGGWTYYTV